MQKRGSQIAHRWARLRLAAAFAISPAAFSAGTRAQTFSSLAHLDGANGLIGLSLGAGLVVFAAGASLLLLAGRKNWSRREAELLAEAERSRQAAERARAFLAAETQFVVVWGGESGEPDIEGDVTLVIDTPSPRQALGFGAWLPPDEAQALEANVVRLRERGQGFCQDLVGLNGRYLEAEGRAIGSRVVMRVRDVSGERLELVRLREDQAEQKAQLEIFRGLLDLSPHPAWMRGADQRLNWVNQAYARAVDAKTPRDAIDRDLELLDRGARETALRARESGEIFRQRLPVVVAGERRLMDVYDAPLSTGAAGMADDLSELENLRADHARQMESHIRTLDQLATAVAIFDHSKKLVFANAAYRQLWSLDQVFLDQRPSDSEILDQLRADRRLPEQADFRAWKSSLLEVYHNLDPAPQVWHLPDGRTLRVGFDPNPQGGVTYLFDDVTERFNLESQYNALARVQSETLDALQEGVAVFGADGRLKFFNPAFGRIWRLPVAQLAAKPHIDAVTAACKPLLPDEGAWADLRSVVAGLHDARMGFQRRMARSDGSIVDCAAAPLPDGGTLLTFIDVTDGVNVERALTERNQALLAAEQLRNDFVHHVSYELRSPLTNIIGFIQLLGDQGVGPLNEKQREYAGYVMKSSAALLAIINDILDLATIDRDAMELQLGEVDIERTIEEAAAGVQDRLAESHVELSVVTTDGIGAFQADGKRVRQILFNLLSNAIGFSEPGQTVTLAALRRDSEIVFKVSDQGRGIPPELLDKVFDRFESHTLQSRHRGVGLGLSIVRAFVERHGGKVLIDSAPGEGTVVTCLFPLVKAGQFPLTAAGLYRRPLESDDARDEA
ncbi:ATP-binding protein [Rhodoblastus sp.]|uniref:sensor histidine kinase n=1 Tax=Rhodoblastus sp. TaxID=1962975 RepID=UPI003F97B3CA